MGQHARDLRLFYTAKFIHLIAKNRREISNSWNVSSDYSATLRLIAVKKAANQFGVKIIGAHSCIHDNSLGIDPTRPGAQ